MATKYKDSGIPWIGDIPSDWEVCRLKNLHTDSNVGESIDKSFCSDNPNDTLFYTAGVKPIHTTYLDFPEWKYTQKSNLLLSRNGTPYVYIPIEGAVYSDHIIRIDINNNCSKEFVRYCLQQSIASEVVDSVSIATWSMSLWNKQILPFPPLSTQQRIADFLDRKCAEIDELAALQETMIVELKRYKQSVITEAVTKGLDLNAAMKDSGVEWIGKIPEGWEVKKVKNVTTAITKGNGITKEDVFDDGDTPCVRYGEIYSKYDNSFVACISKTKKDVLSTLHYFGNGDILCAGTGELVEEIGKSIVYLGENQCLAGGDIIVLCHNQNPLFLNFALNSRYAQAQKSCSKAKLKVVHISAYDIGSILIALPSLSEQRAIADYLDKKCAEIDELIAIKQQKIEALKEYKKSVIFEYVTGKRVL